MRSCLIALTLVAVASCTGDRGQIRIDMGELVERAAQSSLELESLTLTVTGPGIDPPIRAELDFDNPVFDLAIPSGPNRRFLVEAKTAAGFPVYWGELITIVDARSNEEIVIPAFPAGRATVTLDRLGTGAAPERVPLRVTALDPRQDQRPELVVDATAGIAQVTLPTGAYEVRVGVITSAGPDLLAVPEISTVTVVQGEATSTTFVLAPPDACAPDLGQTPDLDRDGLSCDVDCDDLNPNCGTDCTDNDGDDYCVTTDCDDTPGAGVNCQETCQTFFVDEDGDGFGDDDSARVACAAPVGTITVGGDCDDIRPGCNESCTDSDNDGFCGLNDCDDSLPGVNPDGTEFAGDGVDSNCDGLELCYFDGDLDGDGDRFQALVESSSIDCSEPGVARSGADCDDNNSALSFIDRDGDGSLSCVEVRFFDCDEDNPQVHSGKSENCIDGIDNDCDGLIDFFDEECIDFVDTDSDGYNESPTVGFLDDLDGDEVVAIDCPTPDTAYDFDNDGISACDGDCDDTNPEIYPGAPLRCTPQVSDSNCNGQLDAIECVGCIDADGDGYCSNKTDADCDDTDPEKNLRDIDRNGLTTCSEPIADCDDTWFLTPIPLFGSDTGQDYGLLEFCYDGYDNDCDGFIDAADPDCSASCSDDDNDGFRCDDCDDDPQTGSGCFAPGECSDRPIDADGDRYFDTSDVTRSTCDRAALLGPDCDDTDPSINPSAIEVCGDDINSNCSSFGDPTLDDNDRDADFDGFIDGSDPSCGGDDCDDNDPLKGGDFDGDGENACIDPNDYSIFATSTTPDRCDGLDNDGDGGFDNFVPGDSDADADDDFIQDCEDNCPFTANGGAGELAPEPTQLELRWLSAYLTGDPITWDVYINGSLVIADYQGSYITESCPSAIPPKSSGPRSISGIPNWKGDGSDTIQVDIVSGDENLFWVQVVLDDGQGALGYNTFPYYGDPQTNDPCGPVPTCVEPNCPGFEQFIPPPFVGGQEDDDGDGIGNVCDCDFSGNLGQISECPSDCVDSDSDGFCDSVPGFPEFEDCNDSDSLANPGNTNETSCTDSVDNDCDGKADLEDADCAGSSVNESRPVIARHNTMSGPERTRVPICAYQQVAYSSCGTNFSETAYFSVEINNPGESADTYEIYNAGPYPVSIVEVDSAGDEVGCVNGSMGPGTFQQFGPPPDGTIVYYAVQTLDMEACTFVDPRLLDISFNLFNMNPDSTFDHDQDGIDDAVDPCIDFDRDGYGERDLSEQNCPQLGRDCDDRNPLTFPGAIEVCDGADNNCDHLVDEGFAYDPSLLIDEDFESGNPFTSMPLSGDESDWAIVTGSADGTAIFGSQWVGTDGGLNAPEDSVLETEPFSFDRSNPVLLQFDSYAFNEGGCPGMGPDGEELEYFDGTKWNQIIPCPSSPLNDSFSFQPFRRLTFPIPVGDQISETRVRWHFNSGGSRDNDGWYIDNVRVYQCEPLP